MLTVHDPEIHTPRRRERGFADRVMGAATTQVANSADNP